MYTLSTTAAALPARLPDAVGVVPHHPGSATETWVELALSHCTRFHRPARRLCQTVSLRRWHGMHNLVIGRMFRRSNGIAAVQRSQVPYVPRSSRCRAQLMSPSAHSGPQSATE
jgi:hypothetical protein